jgi:hypothetical protein
MPSFFHFITKEASMFKPVFACIIVVMVFFTSADARILHVPSGYSTIKAGIQAAVDGDTVLIEPGTYKEGLNFNGKKITISHSHPIGNERDLTKRVGRQHV